MNVGNHLEGLLGDLRFTARSLRRSPGFAATTIVSLALGVVLMACTLSVMNSYVVRAMPFPHSERLRRRLSWDCRRCPVSFSGGEQPSVGSLHAEGVEQMLVYECRTHAQSSVTRGDGRFARRKRPNRHK